MIISVPASSANLGPGFDTLGMALTLPLYCKIGPGGTRRPETEQHPATIAFRHLGGDGPLTIRTSIPSGRGLGFSGAARVAGLVAAVAQREGAQLQLSKHYDEILEAATELEGHGDNAAASLYGGCVAFADGHVARIRMTTRAAFVAWIPATQTSTHSSRGALPERVSMADAVFNVGRTALLVAALSSGDTAILRSATQDRLHQDVRLAAAPASKEALEAALATGAWAAWLSGSGPTVAALCAPEVAADVAAALPKAGRTQVLRVDRAGARLLPESQAARLASRF